MSPFDALGLLLAGLGAPPEALGGTLQARAAHYQGEAAGTRLLVILDNAASAAQVRPLLPSAAGCRVLVTSRNRLAALDDAHRIALPTLGEADGAALFRAVAGHPEAAPTAVERIVAACGAVPLAIRIAAARCRPDSALTPELLAAELAAARGRIAHLEDGERSVGEAFTVSFASMPPDRRRMFALLGLHPPTSVDAWAAGSLADLPAAQAGRLMEQLFAASLLEPHGPGRHHMHDLLAQYAGEVAERTLSPRQIRAAVGRMLDAYLHACHAADLVLTPHRYRFPLAAWSCGTRSAPAFADYGAARAWLTEQLDTLSALCETAYRHGFDEHCWQLAYTLRGVFFLGKHWTHWESTHEIALASARRAGDPKAEGMVLNNLGLALGEQGRVDAAQRVLAEAVAVCRANGDPHGEHTARSHRAWLFHCGGRYREALAEQSAALAFHRETGSRRNAAIILRDMAATEMELGRIGDALRSLRRALGEFERLGLLLDHTMTLNALGEVRARTGDLGAAEQYHQAALIACRESGSVYERARAHAGLGKVAARTGTRPARARHQLTRALRLFDATGAQNEAERIRADLGLLADAAHEGTAPPPTRPPP